MMAQTLPSAKSVRWQGAFTARNPGKAHLPFRQNHRDSLKVQAWQQITEIEVGKNWISTPSGKQPKGIIHFVGGAFAGAAPQFAYQFLIKWLANAGYTVVSTPYAVTFRHLDCARYVNEEFLDTVSRMRQGPESWMVPGNVPVHGVGHSNGALMHLLIGSNTQTGNASNVIISYNNKEVKEAIPVPLNGIQDAVRNARRSNFRAALPTTEAILEGAIALSAATRGVLDRRTAFALKPALDQIGSVLEEVGDGLTDFIPSPPESRDMIAEYYNISDTMLLRFADDGIDESPLALTAIRQTASGVSMVTLPGSHVTPCGGDLNWEVGPVFTPLDAIALAGTAIVQRDLRRAAEKIASWLNDHN